MILIDVNVLVYAHREEMPDHERYRDWLARVLNGPAAFGMSEFVLSAFVRIVTHPRVFHTPDPLNVALEFCEQIRQQPHCVLVAPGPRHWDIFVRLCRAVKAKGNLIPDAYLAALAIEAGCEWYTTDRDFERFPGLVCRHPLRSNS